MICCSIYAVSNLILWIKRSFTAQTVTENVIYFAWQRWLFLMTIEDLLLFCFLSVVFLLWKSICGLLWLQTLVFARFFFDFEGEIFEFLLLFFRKFLPHWADLDELLFWRQLTSFRFIILWKEKKIKIIWWNSYLWNSNPFFFEYFS